MSHRADVLARAPFGCVDSSVTQLFAAQPCSNISRLSDGSNVCSTGWPGRHAALRLSSKPNRDGLITCHRNTHLWPRLRGNMEESERDREGQTSATNRRAYTHSPGKVCTAFLHYCLRCVFKKRAQRFWRSSWPECLVYNGSLRKRLIRKDKTVICREGFFSEI